MWKTYLAIIMILTAGGVIMFSSPVSAEQVKCHQCPKDYPCVTLFEFKNVRFTHNLYCTINNGKEVWNSEDEEKFDIFYFESPNSKNPENELKI